MACVCAVAGYVIWRHTTSTQAATNDASIQAAAELTQTQSTTSAAAVPSASPAAAETSEPASRPAAAELPATEPAAAPAIATPAAPAATVAPSASSTATAPAAPSTAPAGVNLATVIADAKVLVAKNDLLAARRMLNQALITGQLPADSQAAAKTMLSDINHTAIFSSRRLPGDEWVEGYAVQPGDLLRVLAPRYGLTPDFVQRINKISDPRKMRYGTTVKMVKGPFHAVVTKSTFTLDLYLGAPGGEGSLYVCSFPVGLGQDDSTPTGRWEVAVGKKLAHPVYYDPRNQGVVYEGSDPHNPLGDYWIGLTGVDGEAVGKLSYGIHGTIEPDSVGKMSSLGCIRLRNEDVKQIYEMLIEGKSLVIVKP